jgi:hypothetical protein
MKVLAIAAAVGVGCVAGQLTTSVNTLSPGTTVILSPAWLEKGGEDRLIGRLLVLFLR